MFVREECSLLLLKGVHAKLAFSFFLICLSGMEVPVKLSPGDVGTFTRVFSRKDMLSYADVRVFASRKMNFSLPFFLAHRRHNPFGNFHFSFSINVATAEVLLNICANARWFWRLFHFEVFNDSLFEKKLVFAKSSDLLKRRLQATVFFPPLLF